MSQIRKDIITGQWVIFASNRHKKPYAFRHMHTVLDEMESDCPFCPGNEDETPKAKYCGKDGKNWDVRVFDNMYPAINMEKYEADNDNFYVSKSGRGVHEIVVDTPNHHMQTSDLNTDEFLNVLEVMQERFIKAKAETGVEYVQIFKNNGPMAGASISHSHWQIMGVPFVPEEQEKYTASFKEYKAKHGTCLMCDIIGHEKEKKLRIVSENEEFIAFTPYASRVSFEIWVVPKKHVSSFAELEKRDLMAFAGFFIKILKKTNKLREGVCYNIGFEDEPCHSEKNLNHWYVKIMPRISAMAGFEYSTFGYINPVLPEDAAKKLRNL